MGPVEIESDINSSKILHSFTLAYTDMCFMNRDVYYKHIINISDMTDNIFLYNSQTGVLVRFDIGSTSEIEEHFPEC
jgi:hypothetical protein